MNDKIRNYVDALFSGVPRTKRAMEQKDEILADLNDRYNDSISQGKTESEAFSLTVANMGDVDALLRELLPDENFQKEAARYRNRKARNVGAAVCLYILGAAVIVCSALFNSDNAAVIGVVILLVLAALATGLIVYTYMSTPPEFKNEEDEKAQWMNTTPAGRRFKGFLSIYWSAVTAIYLVYSFLTMQWHISWIIWPVAGIASGIIRTVWELKENEKQ